MGKGVATALVEAFEARIRPQHSVYWAYVYKDNRRAIRFYEKSGFYLEREDDRGLVYAKRLNPQNPCPQRD
jgi:ribosomal protein S18 acetylase RimI-like enzyme